MATREIAEWNTTDASNNFPADEGGHKELMKRSDVNDANRANMGSVRRWYEDPEWLDLTVGASITRVDDDTLRVLGGDFTSYFTAGRRIKLTGGSTDPFYATVISSATAAGDTDVELFDFSLGTEIPTAPNPTAVFLFILSTIDPSVFSSAQFLFVTVLTDVAIQAAIDALEASSGPRGGILFLEPDATYIIDNTINIGHGARPGNIRIIGRGATLEAQSGTDGGAIIQIQDDIGANIDAYVTIEDVAFDGNSTVMTAASDGLELLQIGIRLNHVSVTNCTFNDSHANGISILQQCKDIWIQRSSFTDMGENGILVTDATSINDRIFISNCSFDNPSARSGFTTGSGIDIAGRITVGDCQFVNMDHATDTQVGITVARKIATSPVDQSGHNITVTGCRFEGSGLNARGIWLRGRENVVSGCSFRLTGSGSQGVRIDSSTEESNFHTISGCNFYDCSRGVRLFGTGEDCLTTGCTFFDSPNPYTDAGLRNKFSANTLKTCVDGVRLESPALDPMVSDNLIHTCSGDAIEIIAGVSNAQIYWNSYRNITGENVLNGGSDTIVADNRHLIRRVLYIDAGEGISTTIGDVTDGEIGSNDFFVKFDNDAQYADGNVAWVISDFSCAIDLTQVGGDLTFRLRLGPNRLIDPSLDKLIGTTHLEAAPSISVKFPSFTPEIQNTFFEWLYPLSVSDEFYLSIQKTSGGGSDCDFISRDDTVRGEGNGFSCKLQDLE